MPKFLSTGDEARELKQLQGQLEEAKVDLTRREIQRQQLEAEYTENMAWFAAQGFDVNAPLEEQVEDFRAGVVDAANKLLEEING